VLVANRKQGCADSSDPSEHGHDRLRGTTPLRPYCGSAGVVTALVWHRAIVGAGSG
jgi:hypothetical protein